MFNKLEECLTEKQREKFFNVTIVALKELIEAPETRDLVKPICIASSSECYSPYADFLVLSPDKKLSKHTVINDEPIDKIDKMLVEHYHLTPQRIKEILEELRR